jgi:hypothetical protein
MDEIAGVMTNIEDGTTQFLDGAHPSQLAANGLNELAAKLAGLRSATGSPEFPAAHRRPR